MSYNLTLHCGCVLRVTCDSRTDTGPIRVIETPGDGCAVRTHDVGARIYLWELLPNFSEHHETLSHHNIQWF